MGDSLLGPLAGRTKTDIRVPTDLANVIDQLSHDLGIPKNAFYTAGAILFAEKLVRVDGNAKRKRVVLQELLDQLESLTRELKKAT